MDAILSAFSQMTLFPAPAVTGSPTRTSRRHPRRPRLTHGPPPPARRRSSSRSRPDDPTDIAASGASSSLRHTSSPPPSRSLSLQLEGFSASWSCMSNMPRSHAPGLAATGPPCRPSQVRARAIREWSGWSTGWRRGRGRRSTCTTWSSRRAAGAGRDGPGPTPLCPGERPPWQP